MWNLFLRVISPDPVKGEILMVEAAVRHIKSCSSPHLGAEAVVLVALVGVCDSKNNKNEISKKDIPAQASLPVGAPFRHLVI